MNFIAVLQKAGVFVASCEACRTESRCRGR